MERTERRRGRTSRTLLDYRVVLASLVASTSAGFVAVATLDSQAAGKEDPSVIIASGADRYPSLTAADWVTHADYVVIGTVNSERRLPPSQEERDRGEGLIMREVSVNVEKVLWTAPGIRPDAPESFVWPALGWQFTTDPEYQETLMTGAHEPRLEEGNSYIFAIEKPGAYCDGLSGPETPEWRGLGATGVLPVSEDVVGAGEFENRRVRPEEAQAEWASVGAEFAASMAGQHVSALAGRLNGTDFSPQARDKARADKCAAVR